MSEYGDRLEPDIKEPFDLKNRDQMKKYFLTIGLNMKFKYSNQLNSNVSITDLFDRAINQKIPIADWKVFIFENLQVENR